MALDPALVAGLAEKVAGLYAAAEDELIAATARYAAADLDTPRWIAHQQAQLLRFRAAAAGLLSGLAVTSAAEIRDAVGEAARIGDRAAQADLGNRLHDRSVWRGTSVDTHAVHALAEETVGVVTGTHPLILRASDDAYRRVVAQVAGLTVTGVFSQRQALQRALDEYARQGVTGYIDGRGRRWHMDTYAEMAVRTATFRALNAGHTARLIAAGHDLVYVSAHPRPAPQCARFEHRLISLTGATPNGPYTVTVAGETVTETVVASMAQAEAEGLHHPNCRHRHHLWKPGKPVPDPPEADPQGYRDEQTLRRLERAARAARRAQAAAITPAAKKAAADRLAAVENAIADHVKTTGVPRRRHREVLREGNPANAITPANAAKPKPKPSTLTDAELAKAIKAAENKIAKLKKLNSLLAMPAQAHLVALRHELRRRNGDFSAPTELEERAAAVMARIGASTPAEKVALSQAKIAFREQLAADRAAFQAWLSAEADHEQHVATWLAAENQWNADITEWLAAEAKYGSDVRTWLDAEHDHRVSMWLAAESKFHAEITAWLSAEKKYGHDVTDWLDAESKHNAAVAAAAATSAPAPAASVSVAASSAFAASTTTPAAFDPALNQLLAAKLAKDWSTYDPLKATWAAQLGVSEADLNNAINDLAFGSASATDVKAGLAAAKGGPSGSYKSLTKPPAWTPTTSSGSSGPKTAAQDDVGADLDVVPDPSAPVGSAEHPRHFPRTQYGDWTDACEHASGWFVNDIRKLSDAARAAIKYYTGKGYTSINSFLRKHKGKKPYAGHGEELDKLFDTAPRTSEWLILTRGTGIEQLGLQYGEDPTSMVGQTIPQHGYTSTSIGDEPAFDGTLRMIIRTPPGTKAIYMDGKPGQSSHKLTAYSGEREVLLARSTHFKIISVTKRSGGGKWKYDVVCEIVKQDG